MQKKSLLILLVFLLISLFSFSVGAEADTVQLADIVETIEGFNIGEAYGTAPYVIDGIIYLILFIGIAQVTLGKRFEGKGGKAVSVAVGLALAFALSFWSINTGFMLGKLGPLAGMILVIVIGLFIYRLVRGNQEVGTGIWMGIFFIYIMVYVFFQDLIEALSATKWGRFALAIFNILGLIAIPMVLVRIFRMGKSGDPNTPYFENGLWPSRRDRGDDGSSRPTTPTEDDDNTGLVEDMDRLNRIGRDLEQKEREIDRAISSLGQEHLENLTELGNLLQALDKIVIRLNEAGRGGARG